MISGALLLLPPVATGGVLAHNAWIQPSTAVAEPGEPVYLDVFLGNHSRNHRSYRIAGKVDPAQATVRIYGPGGRVREPASPLVDYGEDTDSVPPRGVKGYLGTWFLPDAPGLYLVVLTSEKVVESLHPPMEGRQQHGGAAMAGGGHAGAAADPHAQHMQHMQQVEPGQARAGGTETAAPTFRQVQTAKTFVAVVDGHRRNARRLSGGWDQAVSPRGMELVPLQNPTVVQAGDTVAFQLLLKGKPAPGEMVGMVRRSDGWFREARTDDQGMVRFSVPGPDYYLVTAMATRESPGGDLEAFEATLTFVAGPSPSR